MLEKFQQNLYRNCEVKPSDRLLVGVSGGPDSLALLLLLRDAGFELIAAHLNHQLLPEADDEESGVREIAENWNIPFISKKADVRSFSENNSMSIEEAARVIRYRFLFEQALEWDARAVAVAHTADDQVETILMHLLRGAGLHGLSGMKWRTLPNEWSSRIPLLRPMLSIWRSEIMELLMENKVQPYWDESNEDERYFRNRVRKRLIPYLETYNPAIRKLLWQTCDIMQAEEALLDQLEMKACKETILNVEISVGAFRKLPLSLKRRVIRRIWRIVTPETDDIEYEQVNRVIEHIDRDTEGLFHIANECYLLREFERLYLCYLDKMPRNSFYQVTKDESKLTIPGKTQVGDDLFIQAELLSAIDDNMMEKIKSSPAHHAWIDYERCKGTIVVRSVNPGDRFAPLQLGGHHTKISDIYVNRKIPKRYRAKYPLICDNERVIWIPGYTISHDVRVDGQTRMILHLFIEQRSRI